MRYPTSLVLVMGLALVARAERLPVENFAHEPVHNGVILSPDGKMVAYDEIVQADQHLFLRDLEREKKISIEMVAADATWEHASEFFWTNNRRIVFRTGGGYCAVDRDGTHAQYFLEGSDLLYLYRDEAVGMMLTLAYEHTPSPVGWRQLWRPYILKVNPRFNTAMREVDNPGNVVAWSVNPQGEVTVAVENRRTQYRVIYRSSEKMPWRPLPGLDWDDPGARPLGFSADGHTLYLTRATPAGTWGIYPYDLNAKSLGEPLLTHPKYDIIPGFETATANDVRQQTMIFSPKEKEPLGIRYLTEYPKVLWLNPELAQVQAGLNEVLPGKINTITSFSDDRQRFIVYSWTASDPGAYYLYDRQQGRLEKLMARRPWIDPAQMAEVKPVKFKSRDGTMINGYLTFPPGRETKQMPLVVLVRSNAWARAVWEFDNEAQFLANRGYLVLQVSQRGVDGYGEGFRRGGYQKLAAEMQFDVADGVRWTIQQQMVDAKRVGIIGSNDMGGTLALLGLIAEPELYCCGLAVEPKVDLLRVLDRRKTNDDESYQYAERIGDSLADPEAVRAMSPLYQADKIKAAVMIMYKKDFADRDYNNVKQLVAVLQKAGREVEFLTKFDQDRYGYQRRAKGLNDMETFLAKHMPADN